MPTKSVAKPVPPSVTVNVHVPPVAPEVTVNTAPGPVAVLAPANSAVAGTDPDAAPDAFVHDDATVNVPVNDVSYTSTAFV